MKLIVFSDSHGKNHTVRQVLRRQRDVDLVIHAGDGAPDFIPLAAEYPDIAHVAVRGNCDFAANLPLEEELTLEGVRILVTHGHKYNVKFSLGQITAEARRRGIDLVIFGHTHNPCEQYVPSDGGLPPVYLFNPGSALTGDFGVIDIRDGQILMSHGSIF